MQTQPNRDNFIGGNLSEDQLLSFDIQVLDSYLIEHPEVQLSESFWTIKCHMMYDHNIMPSTLDDIDRRSIYKYYKDKVLTSIRQHHYGIFDGLVSIGQLNQAKNKNVGYDILRMILEQGNGPVLMMFMRHNFDNLDRDMFKYLDVCLKYQNSDTYEIAMILLSSGEIDPLTLEFVFDLCQGSDLNKLTTPSNQILVNIALNNVEASYFQGFDPIEHMKQYPNCSDHIISAWYRYYMRTREMSLLTKLIETDLSLIYYDHLISVIENDNQLLTYAGNLALRVMNKHFLRQLAMISMDVFYSLDWGMYGADPRYRPDYILMTSNR